VFGIYKIINSNCFPFLALDRKRNTPPLLKILSTCLFSRVWLLGLMKLHCTNLTPVIPHLGVPTKTRHKFKFRHIRKLNLYFSAN
jgi:hypothetical protein